MQKKGKISLPKIDHLEVGSFLPTGRKRKIITKDQLCRITNRRLQILDDGRYL